MYTTRYTIQNTFRSTSNCYSTTKNRTITSFYKNKECHIHHVLSSSTIKYLTATLAVVCKQLAKHFLQNGVAYKSLISRFTTEHTSGHKNISQSAVDLRVTGNHFQTLTIPSRDDVTMSVWLVRQRARSVMMSWCPTGGRSGRQRSSVGVVRGLP